MRYARMPIEQEAPEEYGYERIRFNLAESSLRDRSLRDLGIVIPDDLLLLYGEHRGDARLRALVAEQQNGLQPEHVLVTAGAAGALFIIATTLLSPHDHLIVMRPNYATNIETPRAIGCDITHVDLRFENGFALDIERVAAALRPNTRMISVTCPHNPTGTMLTRAQLDALIALAEAHDVRLLVDETYRDLAFAPKLPMAASLSPNAISVSSVSKALGIPGVRVGWLITQDAAMYERFLAAKEQIGICGSVIDEWIAAEAMATREDFIARQMPVLHERLRILRDWVEADPRIDWIAPSGGVVCMPRLSMPARYDFAAFHQRLLIDEATYVGRGHWFEMPDDFIRIGFGWPSTDELRGGLEAISKALTQGGS